MSTESTPDRVEQAMIEMEEATFERTPPMFDSKKQIADMLRGACNNMQAVASSTESCATMLEALTYVDWTSLLVVCACNSRMGKKLLGLELYTQVCTRLSERLTQEIASYSSSRAYGLFMSAEHLSNR